MHEMVFGLKRAFIYKPLRWKLERKHYSQQTDIENITNDIIVIASLLSSSSQFLVIGDTCSSVINVKHC